GGTATLVDCEFSEGSFAGGASGRDAAWVESRMLLLKWAGAGPLHSGRVEAHRAKGAVAAVAPTSSTEYQHWSGTTTTTTTTTPAVDDEEL
ncbi:unnamed protein product, partial [Ectocarpus sp. 12 AP-2014]